MKKEHLILFGFVLLKFVLQYVLIDSGYDLHRDEFLHLDQAKHLAWGYQSVPPFTSWVSYIIFLLGGSVFWVKFFPGLFGALTIVVVWLAVEELGGNLFAKFLAATCVLLSVLLRLNLLYQPNSFDVLCWTAVYYLLIVFIHRGQAKWLYAAAVVFAIGFLNKYNIIFLALGLLPALLLTEHRSLLMKRDLYLAALLALVIVMPNLVWQIVNDFPVIGHLNELAARQLVNVSRLGFVRAQLLFFFGSMVVLVSGVYALIKYAPFRSYRLFMWSMTFTLAIFVLLRAKDYYAIGIYPIYLAFGAVFLERLPAKWIVLRIWAISMPLGFMIPASRIAFLDKDPLYIINHHSDYSRVGMLRWEDGQEHALPQDNADMLGWKELAQVVDSVYAGLPPDERTLVLCHNYGQAGAINYYSQSRGIDALSYHADYHDWFDLNRKIENAILVREVVLEPGEIEELRPAFDTVYLAAVRVNLFAREDSIPIYVLRGARIDVNERVKKELREED